MCSVLCNCFEVFLKKNLSLWPKLLFKEKLVVFEWTSCVSVETAIIKHVLEIPVLCVVFKAGMGKRHCFLEWGACESTCVIHSGSSQRTVFLLVMESRCSWALEQLQDRLVQPTLQGLALPLSSAMYHMIPLPWCLHFFRSSLRVIQCCRQEAAAVPPLPFKLCPASKVNLNLIQNTQQNAVSLEPAVEQQSWFV